MARTSGMRRRHRVYVVILVVVVLAGAFSFVLSRHRQLYRMTILQEFNHRVVEPCAINDRGQIAGFSRGRFYLWERGEGWRELGRSSDVFRINEVFRINNAGQISGTVTDPNLGTGAFLWDPNDGLTVLGVGPDAGGTLNNRGQMAGLRAEDPNDPRLVMWDKTRGMRVLNGVKGTMRAMNDAGQFIGCRLSRAKGYEDTEDFLWEPDEDGSITETPLPSGIFRKLTNNGYVIGRAFDSNVGRYYAFFWHKGHVVERLFPFEGMAYIAALNDANEVAVCRVTRSGYLRRLMGRWLGSSTEAFVWTRERGRVFLDGYALTKRGEHFDIYDLNNGGSIVGVVAPNGRSQGARAVLLEPIPERWGK